MINCSTNDTITVNNRDENRFIILSCAHQHKLILSIFGFIYSTESNFLSYLKYEFFI